MGPTVDTGSYALVATVCGVTLFSVTSPEG